MPRDAFAEALLVKEALADLLARQRSLLDVVRRRADAPASSDLLDAWTRVEAATARVAEAAHAQGIDAESSRDLDRARALSALLAAELDARRGAVVGELGRVRDARRRIDALRRRVSDAGHSCDVTG